MPCFGYYKRKQMGINMMRLEFACLSFSVLLILMFILTNTSHCVDGFSRFGSFKTGYASQPQTQMIRPVESTHGGIGGKKDEDGNDKRKIPTDS
ncbi:unnamed protein product [Camellia sinensis]